MIINVFTNSSCTAVGVKANSIVKMTENEIAMSAGANYQEKNNIVTSLGIAWHLVAEINRTIILNNKMRSNVHNFNRRKF